MSFEKEDWDDCGGGGDEKTINRYKSGAESRRPLLVLPQKMTKMALFNR